MINNILLSFPTCIGNDDVDNDKLLKLGYSKMPCNCKSPAVVSVLATE